MAFESYEKQLGKMFDETIEDLKPLVPKIRELGRQEHLKRKNNKKIAELQTYINDAVFYCKQVGGLFKDLYLPKANLTTDTDEYIVILFMIYGLKCDKWFFAELTETCWPGAGWKKVLASKAGFGESIFMADLKENYNFY